MNRLNLLAFVLLFWFVAPAIGAPATSPSTAPSVDEIKAIRSVLRTSVAGVDQGRSEEVADALYASNPEDQKILDSFVDQARGMRNLRKSILDYFGANEASGFVGLIPDVSVIDDELAKMPVTITGDIASVNAGDEVFRLDKVNGVWRIPIASMTKGPHKPTRAEIVRHGQRNIAFIDGTVLKVKAGEFKTAREVSEYMKRMLNMVP